MLENIFIGAIFFGLYTLGLWVFVDERARKQQQLDSAEEIWNGGWVPGSNQTIPWDVCSGGCYCEKHYLVNGDMKIYLPKHAAEWVSAQRSKVLSVKDDLVLANAIAEMERLKELKKQEEKAKAEAEKAEKAEKK